MNAALLAALVWLRSVAADVLRGVLLDLWRDWQARRATKQEGAMEAAEKTDRVLDEIAGDQHAIDAVDRGGADDVARRLRERLRRSPDRSD